VDSVLAWFAAALALFAGPSDDGTRYYGYVEGDYVTIAADASGLVEEIAVRDGVRIAAGDPVAQLDDSRAQTALEAARAQLSAAEATLENLQTGKRPEEITVIEKQWHAALDRLKLARETYERSQSLNKRGVVSQSKLDADRTQFETAQAEVDQLDAQLEVARLPARGPEIEAARQTIEMRKADVATAQIDIDHRRITAPAAGRIEEVFARVGEFAEPGQPLASLLPDGAVKARFFVPEPARAQLKIGDRLAVSCSACPSPIPATVSWIATDAEYTPPVIFSREERAKLVFAADARFEGEAPLTPGQPIDVARTE
jgi:HlyD family secretion protein